MDQLKTIQIFKCVADCKSFSQAAERLDLPRPTVTNAVQRIEQQLGVRLLQRTTRKVSLTLEGSILLERCTRLLEELEEVNALFLGPTHLPSGLLRVDLPERVAHSIVIPALPGFFARYPDIQIKLVSNDRYADLVGEGIDCAVRVGVLRDSSLVARRIGELRQFNCAAPSYLARYGTPRAPADLARHLAVNFFSSQSGRDMDWEYLDEGQSKSIAMRSLVSVTSSEAYLAACLAGLGMIQAPRIGVGHLLDSGQLVEVLAAWPAAPMPVSIVYSHHRRMAPRLRVFVDWLIGILDLAHE